jgi:hypothetical protein
VAEILPNGIAKASTEDLLSALHSITAGGLLSHGDALCDAIRYRIGLSLATDFGLTVFVSPSIAIFDRAEMEKDLDIASDLCQSAVKFSADPLANSFREAIHMRLVRKYFTTGAISPLPPSHREETSQQAPDSALSSADRDAILRAIGEDLIANGPTAQALRAITRVSRSGEKR